MKKTRQLLSLLLVIALTAAACFTFGSCGKNENDPIGESSSESTSGSPDSDTTDGTEEQKTITVEVTDNEGKTTTFTIKTKEEFLGAALLAEKLIEGEEGQYGLYVKVVNGVTADYDTDGAYWGFYKDGEYLMTGVDTTPIADGDKFEIVYTKG